MSSKTIKGFQIHTAREVQDGYYSYYPCERMIYKNHKDAVKRLKAIHSEFEDEQLVFDKDGFIDDGESRDHHYLYAVQEVEITLVGYGE